MRSSGCNSLGVLIRHLSSVGVCTYDNPLSVTGLLLRYCYSILKSIMPKLGEDPDKPVIKEPKQLLVLMTSMCCRRMG